MLLCGTNIFALISFAEIYCSLTCSIGVYVSLSVVIVVLYELYELSD